MIYSSTTLQHRHPSDARAEGWTVTQYVAFPQYLHDSPSMRPMVLQCALHMPCSVTTLMVVLSLPLLIALKRVALLLLSPGLFALACL